MLEQSRPFVHSDLFCPSRRQPWIEFQTRALTMLFLTGASPQNAFDAVTRFLNLMDFGKERVACEVDAAIMSALKMVKELRAVHSSLNNALVAAQHPHRIGEPASEVLGNRDLSTLIHAFAYDPYVSSLLCKNSKRFWLDEHFWSQIEETKPPERGFKGTSWTGMFKKFLPIRGISDQHESKNKLKLRKKNKLCLDFRSAIRGEA